MVDSANELVRRAVEFLIVSFVSALAWFGRRTVNRVDDLKEAQEHFVTRDEFDATIRDVRHDINDGHAQISTRLDRLYVELMKQNGRNE